MNTQPSRKHSQVPWEITYDGDVYVIENENSIIGHVDNYEGADEDAAFIVHAVNSHDNLVKAVAEVHAYLKNQFPKTKTQIQLMDICEKALGQPQQVTVQENS